jgi:hypothetical protein
MPNRLLQKLGADFDTLTGQYETILNRCADEAREPNDAEADTLDGLRSQMAPLGDRIVELRQTDDARRATAIAMGGDPAVFDYDPAALQGDPIETRERPSPLVCSDAQLRSIMEAVQSRTAYDEPVAGIQNRAAAVVPVGAVAPDWLPPVAYGREPRIAEAVTNTGGLGSEADWLEVTSPAIAAVVAEGQPKPDSGLVLSRVSAPYDKLAHFADASLELLSDFSSTQALINMELLGGLQTLENTEIVSAIANNAGILTVTPTGTSRLHAILQAQAAVRAGASKAWPDMVLMNPTDWPSTIGQEAQTSGQLQAGAAVVVDGTGTRLWGMDVFLTVGVAAGTAFVGLAQSVLYVTRDPAHVIIDPWTQLKSNITTTVAEMRSKAGLQRPQSWAKVALPAAGTPAATVTTDDEAAHKGK